ncbi:PAS domain S-box protein [Snuella lapsa]|uniref:histidine kinase n=1 Tax=Snuella lapsa TaxID=870481 RepID=A0ABP6X7F9_9FLAO
MTKAEKEIFDVLLEAVYEGVIIVNNHQEIVRVNASANRFFGYSDGELEGKSLNILIPETYHASHHVYFNAFIEKQVSRKMGEAMVDVYGMHKTGDIFPIEVELHPINMDGARLIMALVKDISSKKEIERSLMLRNMALQSASNGILITDALKPDNPIIYCNTAFQELTGYSQEEVLNKNCRFLQGTDTKQDVLGTLREAIKNGESCQVTLRNYKKDGTMFWNRLFITPITNNNGEVTNFIGIQNDVTLQRKTEDERLHLATILNESLNEIYVFDARTLHFLNVNYGAQRNIGFTMEALKDMTPIDLKPEYTEEAFRKTIAPLLSKEEDKLEFETIHKRKDGSTYPVEVHLQVSYLGDRAVFVAIILDITERKSYLMKLENTVHKRTKQLQEALSKEKEINELKTKFLSLVSHEFKTPLSGILTSATLLGKYKLEEEQERRDRHIGIITDKVHYLNSILNDFLSIEKLETGKVNYKFSDFKLSKVVNEVVYSCNMLLKEGQKINYPQNIDEFSLYQDEKIIELILFNLVYNALKYSPEHSVIDIEIKQDKSQTTFKVEDQGVGIPVAEQKNIFQRYFRAENVLNIQGTGIGLSIVKDHLENLKGTISFKSIEHKGTTFIVTIPNKAIL